MVQGFEVVEGATGVVRMVGIKHPSRVRNLLFVNSPF